MTHLAASRRRLLAAALLAPLSAPLMAQSAPVLEVWKTPSCGCCGVWAERMRQAGFSLRLRDVPDTAPVRARAGLAPRYASCHTALIGGYAIEGHVPAEDIQRLLRERPQAVGLAVPGMPIGSPGMDDPAYGGRRDAYAVLLVQADGGASVWRSIAGA